MTTAQPNILVVDDEQSILDSFRSLLDAPGSDPTVATLDELELALGGAPRVATEQPRYRMHYARQGADAITACSSALASGAPLSVAFIDIQMPPGIDGVETAVQLWRQQPDLEIVLCTAHSTYSWQDILARTPRRDQLVILRKPFEPIEVRQLAACMSEKWHRGRELQRDMERLEAQVQREVARRLQIELGVSQKFESLGRLAAGIAHEINTPTQYIQSSLEFLAETIGDLKPESGGETAELFDSMTGAIGDALSGVARVTAIVRSVREYAHTSDTQHDTVDLNRQIRMAAELAKSQYKYSADLVLDLGELPPVRGHADELGRAILNLVINAAQAITAKRDGGRRGRITITTRATASVVTVSVADTGTGIPDEHRARVFEPFFTTKSLGEGTGQGLAMVRAAIVDRHHGTIDFESVVGAGTTFHLSLPRCQQERAA
ncbi:MAG: hybrid sensor histidine kinase/response regulator [Deltaproteobacteria bacterium]|nr:hybrid sensor histidine kinase/response regulator [Deltaproteobacteria bacterium]